MRILFVTNGFSFPHQPGAPRPYRTARWLVEHGHEVTVFCNRRHYQLDEETFMGTVDAPEVVEGIRVVGLATGSGLRRSLWRRAMAYLALTRETWRQGRRLPPQDVVLAGTPPLLVPAAALALARRWGARSVLEIRDLFPHEAEAIGKVRSKPLLWLWHRWERGLRRRFDHLVFNLPMLVDMLGDEGHDPERCTVIPNGYDSDSDAGAPLPEPIESFFADNAGKTVVGYVGAMGHSWNIPLLLAAAERLRDRDDIAFFLLGKGEHKPALAAEAKRLGLGNIAFFDPVSSRQANTAVRRCDIMVMPFYDTPLHDYSLPNKLFDYMGAGRAIVVAGAKQSAEIVTAAGGGRAVPADDPAALVAAIAELADDPEATKAAGRGNRAYVERHLMRDVVNRRWHRVLGTAPDPAEAAAAE